VTGEVVFRRLRGAVLDASGLPLHLPAVVPAAAPPEVVALEGAGLDRFADALVRAEAHTRAAADVESAVAAAALPATAASLAGEDAAAPPVAPPSPSVLHMAKSLLKWHLSAAGLGPRAKPPQREKALPRAPTATTMAAGALGSGAPFAASAPAAGPSPLAAPPSPFAGGAFPPHPAGPRPPTAPRPTSLDLARAVRGADVGGGPALRRARVAAVRFAAAPERSYAPSGAVAPWVAAGAPRSIPTERHGAL
jgi:hypothetical protein